LSSQQEVEKIPDEVLKDALNHEVEDKAEQQIDAENQMRDEWVRSNLLYPMSIGNFRHLNPSSQLESELKSISAVQEALEAAANSPIARAEKEIKSIQDAYKTAMSEIGSISAVQEALEAAANSPIAKAEKEIKSIQDAIRSPPTLNE
jgi:hypothetical protein